MLEALLAAGAEPDAVDCRGVTPLLAACEHVQTEAAQASLALLRAGASLDAVDANRRGETPLVAFAAARMTACCELLLEADGRPDEEREADAFHALRGAASQGHLPTVRSLLAHGAHPARSIGGEGTAIHAAAAGGHVDVLHVLLDWDALRTTDAEWKSALLCAAASGSALACETLLAAGADIEQKNGTGDTALLVAVMHGNAHAAQARATRPAPRRGPSTPGTVSPHRAGRDGIPDALLAATAAGHVKVALALVELCPLATPPPLEPDAAASASAQVLQAFWRRCYEEAEER
ncbi:hypothetical protein EMIHUDRAFT_209971 [Emiliania huxleyi CCMP1516]|uniref:Ankyrin repeat protein n=2 Tax=Emiliania huxleyi TaxID=2903 RepID=A0A0D3J1E7_EMIH1|nr:hypothetical protein EMIHUDRAFT_209971 [Emiliania huxleyi CCMP1516]EOD17332.1 hypothetical protein EMIHUDRAFT_209971 [Emiliania huxleyi CCMP1516]|eukprot:XP_005769761.1 hypothetical protein EMIHUDRAFT_209971 [Emiliania huxleyi CCMP1516]